MRRSIVTLALFLSVGCKKEKTEPVPDAPLVVVSTPAPDAVAPPVATFDQAQGNPDAMPTVTTPVQNIPVGNTGTPLAARAFERAMEAASEGRSGDVRRLLEAKVRSGHGTADEVRLVRKACSSPYDKACIDDIKAKYPDFQGSLPRTR